MSRYVNGAEAVLKLRALCCSGDIEEEREPTLSTPTPVTEAATEISLGWPRYSHYIHTARWLYLLEVATVPLCYSIACLPSSTSPQVRAAEFEKLHCTNATPERTSQAFKDSHVLRVEPLLARVHSHEVHTIGAILLMAPPKGVTAEQLNEILQCHTARMLLERNNEHGTANDPYFLPGAWLEVSVKSEIGTVSVNVAADNVHDGLLVLQRAKEFARAQVESR